MPKAKTSKMGTTHQILRLLDFLSEEAEFLSNILDGMRTSTFLRFLI